MTPFEKFKEKAALVNHWIKEEKPKIQRFGCEKCKYVHYTHESFDRFYTYNYCVCCCLPNWLKPVARISECPKKNNPNAGKLISVCKVNS